MHMDILLYHIFFCRYIGYALPPTEQESSNHCQQDQSQCDGHRYYRSLSTLTSSSYCQRQDMGLHTVHKHKTTPGICCWYSPRTQVGVVYKLNFIVLSFSPSLWCTHSKGWSGIQSAGWMHHSLLRSWLVPAMHHIIHAPYFNLIHLDLLDLRQYWQTILSLLHI